MDGKLKPSPAPVAADVEVKASKGVISIADAVPRDLGLDGRQTLRAAVLLAALLFLEAWRSGLN